ncbi:uncharacterized protein LOC142235932 [Haematobia irritans]|uniref:uncharacterized protein LOC142235932 n=1 Tax=Haematobia irritans TaxID=7368 RepID=UPI003F506BB1
MPNESGDGASAAQQPSHAIKIPRFWREHPLLWFAQVEAQFALYRIGDERTKYHILVAELDTELLTHVSDIVLNPPNDVYSQIKNRLIEHFSVSEENRIKRLLNNMEIGQKKPSLLLREMRSLSNGGVTEDFLRTMWMQRLPSHSQAILSTSTESLDNLAKMADKIADISTSGSVSEITQGKTFDFTSMCKQIEMLTLSVEEIQKRLSRNSSRGRSRSKKRDMSQHEVCYYHRRFGKHAKKCRKPCSFNLSQSENN